MDKEDVVHIYNGILLSHKKISEIMPFEATWMDLEILTLSVVSQTEKDKNRMISLTCGTYKKGVQMNLSTKQK